jgi:thioredoxin reductase
MAERRDWDCIVVGGGAAGLSAALVLGRARRRTLIVDAGSPSNLAADAVGGLLGHDRRPPAELYAKGREELAEYPSAELRAGEVVGGEATGDGFLLELSGGTTESARRVLIAAGMDYRYPAIPGAEERWGHSVFHCPFCHGWEVRDRPLAVLDTGPMTAHRALLIRAWSDDVTLLSNGPSALDAADAERIEAAGVRIDERPIASLQGEGRELSAVAFEDGDELECGALLIGTTLHQRSDLAARLGARLTEPGPVVVDGVVVDDDFESSVPGLYASGDTLPKPPSIQHAISSGSGAAAKIVGSLTSQVAP